MLKQYSFQFVLIFFWGAATVAAQDGYVELFDGKSLEGWVQKGGQAQYRVEDGSIVGQSVPNTKNSFLCTKKDYGNFVLELEYKCHNKLNSGVQFRSTVYDKDVTVEIKGKNKKFSAGRVHGYQCEIDPNKPDRMWSAGIYDEGRRGWLFPGKRGGDAVVFTKQGQKIYKKGEWNAVRIECKGDHIRTWLNGELRADFKDDLTAKGFIALQVHGVGSRTEPMEIRWRNIRIKQAAHVSHKQMPLLFEDDFEKGHANWEIVDSESWAIEDHGKGKSLSITRRKSEHKPKVRSPRHIALIKDVEAADFVLTFKVKSTKDTGNHRDCCVFFNYQNPTNFYYVHLGQNPDPHSGQIMIVKDAPRLALTKNEKVTPWDDEWHDVKLVRNSQKGTIEIYFDDMTKPHMTVNDKTFGKGRIGIGSFDDMNAFDQVELRGQ
jgi:hypothetical protein